MAAGPSTTEDHDHNEIHDQGLQFDLRTLMDRRRALLTLGTGAAGGAALLAVGCSGGDPTAVSTNTPVSSTSTPAVAGGQPAATAAPSVSPIPGTATTPASACVPEFPAETAGPFPGDGSNGPNVLNQSGIVRSDLRQSFGTSQNVAQGIPLTFELTIVDTAKNCAPIPGAAVYAWHCDRDGLYSLYSAGATQENYCRGVQAADANGRVRFVTVFPGAYSGRWPHIHFEVYPSLEQAGSSGNKLVTSQLALPDDVCKTVYGSTGYESSLRNHARTTLQSDGVFRDGVELQMAAVTGSLSAGFTATLMVGV